MRRFLSLCLIALALIGAAEARPLGSRQTLVSGKKLWTPLALGSQLVAWFDPAIPSVITLTGGKVSGFGDRSGNARNLTQSNATFQPTVLTSSAACNGRQALAFAASSLYGASSWFDTTSYDVTVMAAAASGDPEFIGTNGTGTAGDVLLMRYLSKVRAHHWTLPGAIDGATTVDGNAHLFEQWRSGSTLTAYLDGNQQVTNATASGSATKLYVLGNRAAAAGTTFTFCEAIVATALSAIDRQKLQAWYAWRYNTVSLLPASNPYKAAPPTVN